MYSISETETYVLRRVPELWGQFRTVWLELPASAPHVELVVKDVRSIGFAYYNYDKGIRFNLAYVASLNNIVDFDTVIAHELAHIVQYRIYPQAKQAHGKEFRLIMSLMGYAGARYISGYSSKVVSEVVKKHKIEADDYLLKELGL
jgi:predicted SprT family Zn-dependent metalloprotease